MSADLSTIEKQDLADRYESRYGNLDEVLHPQLMMEPVFLKLMETALERGMPLTRAEVEQTFPDVSWDW
jgi:hypothetical protein